MLSSDSSPPDGDLPCCSYKPSPPLVKSSSRATVERASDDDDDDNLALQREVDLLVKSGSLPKFSIRGYVNSYRSKDIEKNWPFSQKNLQLCLRHGVKNPLPPFQPLLSVRNNQPFDRCAVEETSLLEQGINGDHLDVKKPPESSSDHVILNATKKHAPLSDPSTLAAEVSADSNSCRSFPGEKDLAHTATTIHSQPGVLEQSVPYTNGLPGPLVEPPALFEASTSTAVCPPTPSQKGKKCKLIIKLGSGSSDPNTEAEGIASNCTTALSEAMASKTCPVCRVFSSSSNTTLNAHIDQCLSVESTAKWVPESNLNRHKIKARKTRLMADICATAPPCTLEELDRRNGSSWATVDHSTLPTEDPEAEVCAKEKRERTAPIDPGSNDGSYNNDHDDVGAVYIDASGTKLRILSKLNDTPSALKVGDNARLGKALKKNKGCKTLSTNKKRRHLRKHHKYLKIGTQGKQSGSLNSFKFKSLISEEGNSEDKQSREEKQHQTRRFEVQEQTEPQAAGSPRQWVCSKRTGLSKKGNSTDIPQVSGCELHAARDFLIESNQSCLSDSYANSCVQESSKAAEDPIPTPGSNQRMENSIHEAQVKGYREYSPSRKRVESLNSLKKNINPSGNCGTSVDDSRILKLRKFNRTSSLSTKTFTIQARPFRNPENSSLCNKKPFRFTRKPLSVHQSSLPESKSKVHKRYATSKNPHLPFTGEFDEEVVAEGPSEVDQQYDLFCNYSNVFSVDASGRVSPARSNKPGNKEESRPVGFLNWEKSTVTKSSESKFHSYDHDVGQKMIRSVISSDNSDVKSDGPESATKEAQFHVEKTCTGLPSAIDVGETMMSLSESFHHEYHMLTNPFDSHSTSPRSVEKYKLPLSRAEAPRGIADSSFGHGDEFFLADEVANGISGPNTYMGAELDPELEKVNSFSEFEPIQIPGPPGSFLPSPRGMSSDDLQCNSSLSASRVHSSQDQKELIDGDSSDSLVSSTSTISNPCLARSDLNYSEKTPSSGPHSVSSSAAVEPGTKHDASVFLKASFGVKRTFPEGGNLKTNEITPQKGCLTFKDDHMCCCSRKERIPQAIALNYQNSQLLWRRTMSMGKQMGCPPNARTPNSNKNPEIFCFSDCTSLDSACPSASSPILRLMGKNLMVFNKDEDTPTRFTQPQPADPNNCSNAQLTTGNRISPVSTQNQEFNSFLHATTLVPDSLFHDPHRTECFENRL